MVAEEIINKARTDLKKFIVHEMHQILTAKKVKVVFGEEISLEFGEDGPEETYISVFIYDTYNDGNYYRMPIKKIFATLDAWLYVEVEGIEGGETDWEEIKTDDLVAIENALENYYNKLLKK